ncbi:hypothetical protein SAMN05443550_110190 [Pedobacter hartonius]|uniref:Uncharacterized protein n=1 Tax=Pedobacter hartonius TaxID=425514 RepID=A0A1H4GNM2_9SPHI|nr:hypothetical protein SAMN05443550_110190 [Pedobacter hartonius]
MTLSIFTRENRSYRIAGSVDRSYTIDLSNSGTTRRINVPNLVK